VTVCPAVRSTVRRDWSVSDQTISATSSGSTSSNPELAALRSNDAQKADSRRKTAR
jgi:hypothetical protein